MPAYSIFIHSSGTGPSLWASVPAAITAGSSQWFPANLGYAPLPAVPRGVHLTADDDARHLARSLPVDATSARIFGHSYGGLVALKLARLLTIPVESLFLLEPVLFGALNRDLARHPEAAAEVHSFADQDWFLNNEALGGTAQWLEVFIDYWNRPGSWARMPPELQAAQVALGWKIYQEVRSVFYDAAPFASWQMAMPMTVAYGEKTTQAARAMALELLAVNPQAHALHLPGVGHMAIAVKPQVVFTAMMAALVP